MFFLKNKQKLPFMGGFCGHRETGGEGEGRMSLPFIFFPKFMFYNLNIFMIFNFENGNLYLLLFFSVLHI